MDVTVKNVHPGFQDQGSKTTPYTLTTRLVSGHAAVNTTNHPLVAFFSAPPCQNPNFMRARFTPLTVPAGGISTSMTTSLAPCRSKSTAPDPTSMNFYIAGMYPSTTYNIHWETVNPAGTQINAGTDYPFTTGAIPGTVHFPVFSSSGATSDPQQPLVLYSIVTIPVNGTIYASAATDLAGNVLWYSTPIPPVRTENGGNYWGFVPTPTLISPAFGNWTPPATQCSKPRWERLTNSSPSWEPNPLALSTMKFAACPGQPASRPTASF